MPQTWNQASSAAGRTILQPNKNAQSSAAGGTVTTMAQTPWEMAQALDAGTDRAAGIARDIYGNVISVGPGKALTAVPAEHRANFGADTEAQSIFDKSWLGYAGTLDAAGATEAAWNETNKYLAKKNAKAAAAPKPTPTKAPSPAAAAPAVTADAARAQGQTMSPLASPDPNAQAVADAARKHSARVTTIYGDLNKMENPWDVNSPAFQQALAGVMNATTRSNAGATQRTMNMLGQRGQAGGVGATVALANAERRASQNLSDARTGMFTEALKGGADFTMRKADALSRLAGGDLAGAQGAFGMLTNAAMGWNAQQFGQGIAANQERRAADMFPLQLREAAAEVGIKEASLDEYIAGSDSRVSLLKNQAAIGGLSLEQAKKAAPVEMKLLEAQLKSAGIQLDNATWEKDNRAWLILASILGGTLKGGLGAAIGKQIPGVA